MVVHDSESGTGVSITVTVCTKNLSTRAVRHSKTAFELRTQRNTKERTQRSWGDPTPIETACASARCSLHKGPGQPTVISRIFTPVFQLTEGEEEEEENELSPGAIRAINCVQDAHTQQRDQYERETHALVASSRLPQTPDPASAKPKHTVLE